VTLTVITQLPQRLGAALSQKIHAPPTEERWDLRDDEIDEKRDSSKNGDELSAQQQASSIRPASVWQMSASRQSTSPPTTEMAKSNNSTSKSQKESPKYELPKQNAHE
jgi:CCR4-NOT transcriptional regulation complex NOT5 subunit